MIGYEKRDHFAHFKVFAFVILCKSTLTALHFAIYFALITFSVAELRICKVEQYAESDSEKTKPKLPGCNTVFRILTEVTHIRKGHGPWLIKIINALPEHTQSHL